VERSGVLGRRAIAGFLAAGFVVLMAAAPVTAKSTLVVRVDLVFDPPFFVLDCGPFDVLEGGGGFLIIATSFDKQGNLVREVDMFHLDEMTLINSVSGESLTGRSLGPNIIRVEDGTITGLGLFWIVPGDEGPPLVLDAGRIVLDMVTLEVLEASGPKGLNSPEFLGQICSLLA